MKNFSHSTFRMLAILPRHQWHNHQLQLRVIGQWYDELNRRPRVETNFKHELWCLHQSSTRTVFHNIFAGELLCTSLVRQEALTRFHPQPSDSFAFSVTGDVGAIDPALLGTAAVQDTNCLTDFVTIPGAQQNGVRAPGDRFCGLGLDVTTSQARPFVVYSFTDGNETPDIGNRGWSLSYSQNQCPV